MSKPIEPFLHTIRVTWADCDPALIAYTGRIPYFALEAIEAWWEKQTGYNWFELNLDRNIGTPFVHMSIDFSSPVTPRHKLICEVSLLKIGNSSIRFGVSGKQNGVMCFEGEFVSVFVVAKTMKLQRPPAEIMDKITSQLVERDD
ncbi:MAG: acyl-CoA thioesterase [Rhizobiaceae bacterium]|nr:acyl-CoA thioesterase [Rhizobiaceae bacterium]